MADVTDGSQSFARLHLLGTFSILNAFGQDCTPKNRKAQALLAMLALSPRGTRTRAWLRNKLWSDSDEDHSSCSLRQTLFELRKALGETADEILDFDRQSISLRFERLWVDVRVLTDNPGRHSDKPIADALDYDLLEGMDINDEEFEDWLVMERSSWSRRRDGVSSKEKNTEQETHRLMTVPSPAPNHKPVIRVGLLPSIIHGQHDGIHPLGDFITDSIATSVAEFQNLRILDFRLDFSASDMLAQRNQADILIRTRVLSVADSVTLTFLAYSADSQSLLMSQSTQFRIEVLEQDNLAAVNHFIGQNIDQLAKTVERHSGRAPTFQNDRQMLAGYNILSSMFDLDPGKFQEATQLLERLAEQEENTLFKGLLAYSSSFGVGENLGKIDLARLEMIEKLASDALQSNPFNSITLACLGHVYGYVFNRHELAAELFNRAIRRNPMQAFVWDHLALHRFYTGDIEGAHSASERAVYLGTYSPINYSYETTACMISTLSRDFRRALHLGQRALQKQPNFNAAIRYSLVSCGHLEAEECVPGLLASLLANDPGFLEPDIQKSRFRLPMQDSRELVLDGIQRALILGGRL